MLWSGQIKLINMCHFKYVTACDENIYSLSCFQEYIAIITVPLLSNRSLLKSFIYVKSKVTEKEAEIIQSAGSLPQ